MKFVGTSLHGVYLVEPERQVDERGFFARTWCQREFVAHALVAELVQCNISFNARRGTLRGMHFQDYPRREAKLVRCTRGAVYDVVLDLRAESPTFCLWTAFELTAENRSAVYIPQGLAHGFQTLCDDTELFYQMSEFYDPSLARGVRWNDPAFEIQWPIGDSILSEKDRSYPDFIR